MRNKILSSAIFALSLYPAAAMSFSDTTCDPAIEQMLRDERTLKVEESATLADSIFTDAQEGFSKLSCLENLVKSRPGDFFSPPGIEDIFSQLADYACDEATSAFTQARNEMLSRVNDVIGGVPSDLSVVIGDRNIDVVDTGVGRGRWVPLESGETGAAANAQVISDLLYIFGSLR